MHTIRRSTRRGRWLILLLILTLALPGVVGSAWGEGGHKAVTRLAVALTPQPLQNMLSTHLEALEEAAMDPDRRKSEPGVVAESGRHFIDIDALEPYPFKAFPHDLAEAEAKYGKVELHNHGIVPWAIVESFDQLVAAWETDNPEWVRWLGDLSHYVGDSHQPLHATANFDGQKTSNRGIHALFESVMFDGFWNDDYAQPPKQDGEMWWPLGGGTLGLVSGFLTAGPPGALLGALAGAAGGYLAGRWMAPGLKPVQDPLEAAFEIIPNSYAQLEPLLRAHDEAQAYRQTNPKFYLTFWNAGAEKVMLRQINKAAHELARFITGAWLQAGQPSF